MEIVKVHDDREKYMPLLLLADEQKEQVLSYIHKGDLYILRDEEVLGVAIITPYDESTCELKNIAISEKEQGKGYGKFFVNTLFNEYKFSYSAMVVGTGDSVLTRPFYESLGFVYTHRIKDFFLQHYDHPIIEEGVQLKDMIYLRKPLNAIHINELIPNNLYLNGEKINKIKDLSTQELFKLPPVEVLAIDNQYALLDGHSRAWCYLTKGLKEIPYILRNEEDLEEWEIKLYSKIHYMALEQGIKNINDLGDRILSKDVHQELWVDFCTKLIEELTEE